MHSVFQHFNSSRWRYFFLCFNPTSTRRLVSLRVDAVAPVNQGKGTTFVVYNDAKLRIFRSDTGGVVVQTKAEEVVPV